MSVPRASHGHAVPDAEVVLALPVRNAQAEIPALVRCALDQGDAVAVHLFDNASDDETVRVAAELLPVEAIHVAASNAGAVANFQRAFDETTGEFFLWLAHDDRLQPGAVAACLDALRQHPEAAAALPTVRFLGDEGEVVSVQPPLPGLGSASPYRRLWTFVDQVYWVEIYALFRRESLRTAMPMTEGYGFDVVLTWRLLLRQPYCLAPTAVLDYQTYPTKTVQASAAAFYPPSQAFALRRPNATLWRALWRETGRCEDPAARRAGRIALVSVTVRSSTRTRVMRRVRARSRRIAARLPQLRR